MVAGGSPLALADDASTQKSARPPVTKKKMTPIRLTDSQLDAITAGTAEVTTGGGLTIIVNPGHADVFQLNKRGHLTSVTSVNPPQ
jgi:hypothetical protein